MDQSKKHVIIIGAGLGGLTTACLLGKKGYKVTILEKNDLPGGRANLLIRDSIKGQFIFDKGPSWYMMPDIFEHTFSLLGENITDHMELSLLSPSYRVFLESTKQSYDFYADIEKNKQTFESLEKGSGAVLENFLEQTKEQYEIAVNEFMFKNYDSIFDFMNRRVMSLGARLPLFKKQSTIINKKFHHELLRKVMQYQTVLLGTSPFETPGIYTLMNYVDFKLGVWYPKGGIYEIPKALVRIAQKHNVTIRTNTSVTEIIVQNGKASGVRLETGEILEADIIVSNADYHHTEQTLLAPEYREHTERYWDKRTLAPSAFILYLGIDGTIPSLSHHNLLFSKNWEENFKQIFDTPTWPDSPSVYVCAPSKSDNAVAPENTENLFVLVPIASGLTSTEEHKKMYTEKILTLLEQELHIPNLRERILAQEVYSVENFISDYNAFKGTALGLAHTLSQTAIMRPNNISKKVRDLYFVGAGTNPGIGMPICLISAELVYKRIEGITHPHPLTGL